MMLMLIGVGGNVWAAEVIFDAATDVTRTTGSGYSSTVESFTIDGYTWTALGHNLKEGENIGVGKGGANYLQTPELPGKIISVTVTWNGNASYYFILDVNIYIYDFTSC